MLLRQTTPAAAGVLIVYPLTWPIPSIYLPQKVELVDGTHVGVYCVLSDTGLPSSQLIAMTPPRQYGQISFLQKLKVYSLTTIALSLYLLWTAIAYPFSPTLRWKTLKLSISHAQARFVMDQLSVPELQFIAGLGIDICKQWAKKNKQPIDIDNLPKEGARLLWIGPKHTDNVIFYCHGGGFVLPFWDSFLTFWRHAQVELEAQNIHVGVVLMSYNLIPPGKFPSQLLEAKSGLEHLFKLGVKPENILLTGDSAGGNLVLQIFSHLLHPLVSVGDVLGNGEWQKTSGRK
ncbi:uncharacterized protein ARMOST_11391 [Armillaria ostoyae]|uniref:Alpha/beta hydrolase fold-3 domain-containing protein n=1 Tax=Armillaria ostoyae TaxID=47428 RepID=A0A284RH04_ARMOS|nr:uncharacterized protein ARMOST_11391 [Armillaria ostoyae]